MFYQEDKKKIEKFLRKIEAYFKNVPYSERQKLLSDLKEFLTRDIEDSRIHGKSVAEVLSKYKNKKALANSVLQKFGYPSSERTFDGFKIFLWILFTGTIAILIALTIFMKSFFPIYEIDEKNGAMKFFGGRIVLDEEEFILDDDFTGKIIINGQEVDLKTWRTKKDKTGKIVLKGEFTLDQIKEINIRAIKGNFEIVRF